MDKLILAAIIISALIYDFIIGEKPLFIHPTILFGKFISCFEKKFWRNSILMGGLLTFFTILIALSIGFVLNLIYIHTPIYIFFPIAVFILKSTFSINEMGRATKRIITPLEKNDLDNARKYLSFIVSRDTKKLDRYHILSGNLECIGESFIDSIVSPLFFFMIFGFYGCLVFRAVNTLDSMVGYKNERYILFGKISARLDDVLNFIPSRIGVLITLFCSLIFNYSLKRSFETYRKCHNTTESPNSGHIMSLYAGIFGVKLEKKGYYTIGDGIDFEDTLIVRKALKLYFLSTMVSFALVLIMICLLPLPLKVGGFT